MKNGLKRILSLLLALVLLVGAALTPSQSKTVKAFTDNTTMAGATPINIGESLTGTFNDIDYETHYFKFTVPADVGNQWMKFSMSYYSQDIWNIKMDICDSQGDSLLSDSWSPGESAYFITKSANSGTYLKNNRVLTAGTTYYLKLYPSLVSSEGNFALSIESTTDDNWGTFENAEAIGVNQRKNGKLEYNDDMDFFFIDLPKDNRKYTFTVNSDNQTKVLYTNGNRIKMSDVTVSAHNTDASFTATGKGQRIYIWLETGSSNVTSANYSVKVIGEKKAISTLKLTKYKKGTKKIIGRTVSNAKVKVTIKKKKYTVTSKNTGKFVVKLKKKLRSRNKIKISVSKSDYKSLRKSFRVK